MKIKKESGPTMLKISKASVKLLDGFFAEPRYGGRFYSLKKDVLDSLESCPKDEIRIIKPTREMKSSKKERSSLMLALTKNLKKVGWKMRYSTIQKVFYLYREKQGGGRK